MIYIGQCKDLQKRNDNHERGTLKFDKAIREFGRDNFLFWTIDIANSAYEADELEISWIAYVRIELGRDMVYNIADGGNTSGMRGRKHTPEAIQKIKEAATGRKTSEETKQKQRLKKLGTTKQPHTEETKQKMRIPKLGKINKEAVIKRTATRKANRTLHKFSIEQEIQIYQEYLLGGITQKQLAFKYGCSDSKIRQLIKEHRQK